MSWPAATDDSLSFRLSRLGRRGVLLGHTGLQVTALAVGLATAVVGMYVAGGTGLLVTAPVWLAAVVAAEVPVAGRPAVQWLPTGAVWMWRRHAGQTAFRRPVLASRRPGLLGLPGDAAAIGHIVDRQTGAVMVHDPHEQRLVAIAEVTHRSFGLLDGGEQRRRLDGWARVLSTACRSGRIARLQVVERTLPGGGGGVAAWWAAHGSDDGSWVARTYRSLIDGAGPTAERHTTTVSLALDLRATQRPIRTAGGGLAGAAAVLRQEMTGIASALTAADLGPVAWVTPTGLAGIIRSAYDPQAAAAPPASTSVAGRLSAAGPVAVEESWSRLRSDGGWHAVLWISEWPGTPVHPTFLAPLLLSAGVTRAFTLLCEPIPAGRASRDLRRRKTEYLADAAQRGRIGQLEDVRHTAELHDVMQQEAELTAGHGLLRYAALIAVSAGTAEQLDTAVADVEQAAIQAGCETRRLVGQQAQAFLAAALPLCRGI